MSSLEGLVFYVVGDDRRRCFCFEKGRVGRFGGLFECDLKVFKIMVSRVLFILKDVEIVEYICLGNVFRSGGRFRLLFRVALGR